MSKLSTSKRFRKTGLSRHSHSPSSASGRPSAPRSSEDESEYVSDFENLDNGNNEFFFGESIGDQLNKMNDSTDFDKVVEEEVVEEEELAYESDFHGGGGSLLQAEPSVMDYESDVYEESFEPLASSIEQQTVADSPHVKFHNSVLSPQQRGGGNQSDDVLPVLSEFSSITFGEYQEDSGPEQQEIHSHHPNQPVANKAGGNRAQGKTSVPPKMTRRTDAPRSRPSSTNNAPPHSAESSVSTHYNPPVPRATVSAGKAIPAKRPQPPLVKKAQPSSANNSAPSIGNNYSLAEGSSISTAGVKFQKLPITTSGSVATGGGGVAANGSIFSSKLPPAINLHQKPVTSKIVGGMSLSVSDLQKQLSQTLKRLETYKKENIRLLEKLDESATHEALERMKYDIMVRDHKIQELTQELNTFKQVSRLQSKQLVDIEVTKAHEVTDVQLLQERYVELMNVEVKKLKHRISEYRKSEEDMEKHIAKQDGSLKRLRSKVSKLKKKLNEMQKKEGDREDDGDEEDEQKAEVIAKPEENPLNEKTEKSILLQLKTLQRDYQHAKNDIQVSNQAKQRLEEELNKRELFARHQTTMLKTLRHNYEALLESNRQLLQASILFGRDHAVKEVVKRDRVRSPSPPMKVSFDLPIVLEEEAPTFKPKHALIAIDEDDYSQGSSHVPEDNRDATLFLTRVDNE